MVVYYVGVSHLSLPATSGGGIAQMMTGIVVLLPAVPAMPALLKFFAWSGTQVAGGASGGGSGFLGAIGAVAMTREVGRLSQPGRCDVLFVTAFP